MARNGFGSSPTAWNAITIGGPFVPTLVDRVPDTNPAVSSVARPSGTFKPRQSHAVMTRIVTPIVAVRTLSSACVSTSNPIGIPTQAAIEVVIGLAPQDVAPPPDRVPDHERDPDRAHRDDRDLRAEEQRQPGTAISANPNPRDRLGTCRERDDQRDRDEHRKRHGTTANGSCMRSATATASSREDRGGDDVRFGSGVHRDPSVVDPVGDGSAFPVIDGLSCGVATVEPSACVGGEPAPALVLVARAS